MYGLANMTLLLLLITLLVALFAIRLLQGDMDEKAPLSFGQLFFLRRVLNTLRRGLDSGVVWRD